MLKITIACVGKLKEKYLTAGIAEYEKRLKRYCKLDFYQVQDEMTPDKASASEEEKIKDIEAERLKKGIPDEAFVIALDLAGVSCDSVEFSGQIEEIALSGYSQIVFIIGGSLGLSEHLLKRCNARISFSKMTFPHQLMRLILIEQIYRAFRIMRNEPYHK